MRQLIHVDVRDIEASVRVAGASRGRLNGGSHLRRLGCGGLRSRGERVASLVALQRRYASLLIGVSGQDAGSKQDVGTVFVIYVTGPTREQAPGRRCRWIRPP